MGSLNCHIRTEDNRNLLYGIIQDLDIDICIVCETWFEYGTSDAAVNKTFGKDFRWFGRERKNQKVIVEWWYRYSRSYKSWKFFFS